MTGKGDLLDRIERLAKPLIESEGMDLVDLQFKREGNRWYLRLFIDKPGGISLDDCQNISYQIGELLDIEEVIDKRYILEVSSPGLDRPLKREEDYQRFVGRLVKLTTSLPIMGKRVFVGRLRDLENKKVKIQLNSGETLFIPFASIAKARLEVEF
jgi:ribosome maturation factor RimP